MKAGVCRFCGCSEFDACVVDGGFGPEGCSWIDAIRTVCSACTAAAKAETHALTVHPELEAHPSRAAAYHQGFVVGWFGVTGHFKRNPYIARRSERGSWRQKNEKRDDWRRGQMAGEAARHQHLLSCGPLENAPRRAALQVPRRRDRRPAGRVTRPTKRVSR